MSSDTLFGSGFPTTESDLFKDSFARLADHLAANGVDISEGKAMTLGADLKFDPEAETINDNEKASQMLSREYRTGFEVPDLAMKAAG